MGIAQEGAAQRDQVGVARLQDGLGLRARLDEANRHHRDFGFGAAHGGGKRHLITGADLDLLRGGQAPAADVEHVHALVLEQFAELHRLFQVPAALGPVGGAQAHEEGQVVGPDVPHGADDFEQQPGAVFEGAAVVVGARVRQRREELVQQVAVRGVDLHSVEPRDLRAAGGGGKGAHHAAQFVGAHHRRGGEEVVKAVLVRPDDLPAAQLGGHRAFAAPGGVGARFAPGVRELHPNVSAVLVHEISDVTQRHDLAVVPQAQVLGADAALGRDGGGLGQNQSRPAERVLAEVHEVKFVGNAVGCRVGAHGRDDHPVGQFQAAKFKRRKQQWGGRTGRLRSRCRRHGHGRNLRAAPHPEQGRDARVRKKARNDEARRGEDTQCSAAPSPLASAGRAASSSSSRSSSVGAASAALQAGAARSRLRAHSKLAA